MQNKKILLHACCGICAGYPIEFLKNEGYEVVVYYCNPNIDTQEEFDRRLEALKTLCKKEQCELIVEPYNHESFMNFIKGLEDEPEGGKRCSKCFELRLKQTYEKSVSLGIKYFTTTLPVSPHKNFEVIKSIGEKISSDFIPYNFKKADGFLKTNTIAKELNLYRQNYCGCNLPD